MSRTHFWRWIENGRIDLLLFNEQRDMSIVGDVKTCGVVCGAYVDYYTRESVREFDVYDFVICNTQRHYSVFKSHRNALYIPWGTDIDLFRPPATPVPFDDGVVFFHSAGYGGVNNRKGTDLLVQAFANVKGKARLVIHSQVPPARFGSATARSIAADRRITFIERTVGAPGLYHLGHVYVYPSRLDGIGLTVAEALSVGLPVITTDCPPMNEFVTNDHNGLLVRIAETRERKDGYYWPETNVDINDLAAKMQTYVDQRELLLGHSRNARQSAVDQRDWTANSQILLEYLSGVASVSKCIPRWFPLRMRWSLRDVVVASSYLLTFPLEKGIDLARPLHPSLLRRLGNGK